MLLPPIEEPRQFQGLYVYDFGAWTAVGYTAEEIAILLESPEHCDGKVYRIHRALPSGGLELKGVPADRFELESGFFFYRADSTAGWQDFRDLSQAADDGGMPCRAYLHLADRSADADFKRYVTALVFPSEYEDDLSAWLGSIGYAGGDLAEGGISHVTNYLTEEKTILARRQLWSAAKVPPRSAEQVLAERKRPVQRWA